MVKPTSLRLASASAALAACIFAAVCADTAPRNIVQAYQLRRMDDRRSKDARIIVSDRAKARNEIELDELGRNTFEAE